MYDLLKIFFLENYKTDFIFKKRKKYEADVVEQHIKPLHILPASFIRMLVQVLLLHASDPVSC